MAKIIYAGDAGLFKVCSICKSALSVSEFSPSQDGALGREARCKDCNKARSLKWRADNPEKYRQQVDRFRDKIRERSAQRHRERPEYHKAWRDANRQRVREQQRIANQKIRSKPYRRLCDAVAANLNNSIRKGSRQGRKTFDLLGYSRDDLMARLESQFQPGMSWGNYGVGGWHIDHIVPVTAFNFDSPDHVDFRRCWALSNLQPMWEAENISKGNRLDEPFQPSLAL